ncbi:leucine-rich repeat-containing G-protein coupled receptor 4-like [Cydia pomonella]|uniref:leucine-rich repeat-containing G-protein coupled receptor 4-like n=1 Tax=Cydia pomonella TaxID=82600 RepID=UPI002ADE445A|nr:leucine-rich repeat-containing G-protein coupled receptor 4-like [Cydia pomonella]XP_061716545.1 leucine-rich repeat-containing G-protein coupled receptor 4-like [Cydia pomonella]
MFPTSVWWVSVVTLAAADYVTWPGCPLATVKRLIQPNTPDLEATILDLKECNISHIESNNFAHPNLELLAIRSNDIANLDADVFKSLPQLRSLYLGYNRIKGKEIPSNIFQNSRRLERIGFTGNNMTGTPQILLQGLDSLDTLWLDNCSLQEVPFFAAHPSLKQLYLYDNQIKTLDNPDKCIWFENLVKLHLYNNLIESIHENFFRPLKNIENIDMSRNKIRYLPDKLFTNLTSLKTVNLEKNRIEYVPLEAFSGCRNLSHINLSYNKLTFLPVNFVSQFSRLEYLYFERNSWQCACLNDILVEVKSKGVQYRDIDNKGSSPACIAIDFRCHRLKDVHRELFDSMIQDSV